MLYSGDRGRTLGDSRAPGRGRDIPGKCLDKSVRAKIDPMEGAGRIFMLAICPV